MQQNHEILLSTGTQFVTTCEVPALIAKALHPTADFLSDMPLQRAEILHSAAEDEHKRLLRTAIATGQLEQLSPASHIPTNDYIERGKVPVESLTAYVARFKIGVRFGVTMADLQSAEEKVDAIKKAEGRYTLEEAATFINEQTGERTEGMKNKLIAAVKNGELATYAPGSFVKNDSRVVRDFYEHVYWNDLNEWLKKNEPRLDCEFPNPEDTSTDAKGGAVRGITKQQVINAFEGIHFERKQWSNALGKSIPNWLKACQAMPGKQGDNKTSATWNPVLIAAALYGENGKGISREKLNAVFNRLKEWREEWQEVSAQFGD